MCTLAFNEQGSPIKRRGEPLIVHRRPVTVR
jgi:hypothetical protein